MLFRYVVVVVWLWCVVYVDVCCGVVCCVCDVTGVCGAALAWPWCGCMRFIVVVCAPHLRACGPVGVCADVGCGIVAGV